METEYQYYFKRIGCQAAEASSSDCICWHDEGTGPYDNKRHDDDDEYKFLTWRVKPSNAKVSGAGTASAGLPGYAFLRRE